MTSSLSPDMSRLIKPGEVLDLDSLIMSPLLDGDGNLMDQRGGEESRRTPGDAPAFAGAPSASSSFCYIQHCLEVWTLPSSAD